MKRRPRVSGVALSVTLAVGALGAGAMGCGDAASSTLDATPHTTSIPAGVDDAGTPPRTGDAGAPPPTSTPPPPDASPPPVDAGPTAAPLPLDAPPGTWTFVPIAGALCADGSPTGIAFNRSTTSKNVVVYFEGGGACWDDATCNQLGLASYVGGYGATEMNTELPSSVVGSPLDRALAVNPLKDDSFVFIPYCTGDIHGGSKTNTYGGKPFHHVGFDNVGHLLPRLAATFPDAERIVVTGVSAGGFGSAYNFWRFRDAFPAAKMFLVDDSGPPIPAPYAPQSVTDTWRTTWNLAATLPPGCTACATKFEAIFDHYATKYPDVHYALLSYREDPVISTFYETPIWSYSDALAALATSSIAPHPTFRYFYADAVDHVLFKSFGSVQVGTHRLDTWLSEMLAGDSGWVDVTP